MNNSDDRKLNICMIVPDPMVEGGIAAVTSGYYGSRLEKECNITYVQSYCDGSKLKKLLKALRAYREFRTVLKKQRPDIVHIHSSFGPSFYRKLPFISMSCRQGIPVVNHIHGAEFDPFYAKASERKRRLVRNVYSKCTRFICLSDEWKERISQIVPEDRITVIPNYSKSVTFREAEKIWDDRRGKRNILFLGEIGKRKGAYDLPAIFEAVHKKLPDSRLVIGGSGDIEGVRSGFSKDCSEAVVFPGWVRGVEKDALLRSSTVFLLPSYNEGMPMSILDAMGYALPIVSTDVGGIPQIVKKGRNGMTCMAGDTQAIADAVIELLEDYDKAQKAGMESLAVINEQYGFDAHIDAVMKVYREII